MTGVAAWHPTPNLIHQAAPETQQGQHQSCLLLPTPPHQPQTPPPKPPSRSGSLPNLHRTLVLQTRLPSRCSLLTPNVSYGVISTDLYGLERGLCTHGCLVPRTKDLLQEFPSSHLLVVQRLSSSRELGTTQESHPTLLIPQLFGEAGHKVSVHCNAASSGIFSFSSAHKVTVGRREIRLK